MGDKVTLIEADSLKATDGGYQFNVRLNWYRSLPLSSLEKFALALDGQPVPLEAVRFSYGGREYEFGELDEQVETFWFVQDGLEIRVRQPGQVRRGERHELAVEYALRFPYIAIGPGRFLTNTSRHTATQVAG